MSSPAPTFPRSKSDPDLRVQGGQAVSKPRSGSVGEVGARPILKPPVIAIPLAQPSSQESSGHFELVIDIMDDSPKSTPPGSRRNSSSSVEAIAFHPQISRSNSSSSINLPNQGGGSQLSQRGSQDANANQSNQNVVIVIEESNGDLAKFKGMSGKTLGEVSNLLGELSSALVAWNDNNVTQSSTATGFVGEGLFTMGGLWQTVSALKSSKEDRDGTESLSFLQGLANSVSGASGVVGSFANTPVAAQVVSQGAWAIGEGANMIQQSYKYWCVNENWLDTQQIVCLAQFIASALKFVGIVAILSGGSSLWLLAEASGSLVAACSGLLNLKHKGYFSSLSLSAIGSYLERLSRLSGIGMTGRVVAASFGVYNPNAADIV